MGEGLHGTSKPHLLTTKLIAYTTEMQLSTSRSPGGTKPLGYRTLEDCLAQLQDNLRALRRDRVDVLLVHDMEFAKAWIPDARDDHELLDLDKEHDYANAAIIPERRTVPIPRTGLPQSLMRPLFIVAVAKGVKGSLLPSSVRLRRRSRLCLQRPVQPLQPSVLFRVAGLDSLRNDAQLDPPYCQLRQAPKTNACKGRSVVASDRLGQSILPESALKDSLYLRPSGLRKPVADQQVPRGGVLHGERVYANAVAGAEPPFEVDGPNVVGVVRRGKGLAPRCRVPSPFPSTHQPSSVQYVPCRAGRRPTHSWLDPSKRCHHLLRPPRWMGLLGPDQPLGYRPRRLIGMTMRSSATVSQPTPPTRPESLEPPVARLTTYAELAARLYQRHSPSLTLFNEPYLFVFRARLFPGQHIPPDRFAPIFVQCVTHVPGFSVTNVPGLYPS